MAFLDQVAAWKLVAGISAIAAFFAETDAARHSIAA
jgi:hypothetical protein